MTISIGGLYQVSTWSQIGGDAIDFKLIKENLTTNLNLWLKLGLLLKIIINSQKDSIYVKVRRNKYKTIVNVIVT